MQLMQCHLLIIQIKNIVSFVEHNGSTFKYDKIRNIFAIIDKRGYVATYFKPKQVYQYYKIQLNNNFNKTKDSKAQTKGSCINLQMD
jgi:hypothetical protein